jgi:hypothetical protein
MTGAGDPSVPTHLRNWPGLYEWRDGAVVEAPPEDVATARGYPRFEDKGPLLAGLRLTVMSRRQRYRRGEEVRIIHVVEAVEPGRVLYVMGPKPVYGEYVDDVLRTPAPPDDVLEPAIYNGPTLTGPAVDYNYDITAYRFDEAGEHRIQWRLGALRSNILAIVIIP